MNKVLTILLVLLTTTAYGQSWLAGVTYDQNNNTITFETTGDNPPRISIEDNPGNIAEFTLYNTRIRPEKYSISPDDGVVHKIRAEEMLEAGVYWVRVQVELSRFFPFDIEGVSLGQSYSQVLLTLKDVDIERRQVDLSGKVPVWSRPSKESVVADFLDFGSFPVLKDYSQGFFLVKLEDGYTGWVEEKFVKLPGDNPFVYSGDMLVGGDLPETRKGVIGTARKYLGVPYKWGGTTSSGFDCSGLIQTVFSENGIKLPRGSGAQFKEGTKINKDKMIPGDLIFFHTYTSGPSHVGIWLGEGKFLHAESSPAGVTITELSTPYWNERYHGSRRWIK